jgi:hypothetical protein
MWFDAGASVDAALIREHMGSGSRTDREVLESLMSEVEYCEANANEFSRPDEVRAWRAEVERRLERGEF